MVAVDAFSQALTNPLLSEHVFNAATFTPEGMATIEQTGSLAEMVARNAPGGAGGGRISMTQQGWTYPW
jgi:prostaglandin-endoperoxide synthase 2